jgi:hypothetical protein
VRLCLACRGIASARVMRGAHIAMAGKDLFQQDVHAVQKMRKEPFRSDHLVTQPAGSAESSAGCGRDAASFERKNPPAEDASLDDDRCSALCYGLTSKQSVWAAEWAAQERGNGLKCNMMDSSPERALGLIDLVPP